MLVSIDRAGRIVIPKELRDRLSIGSDSEFEIGVEGQTIVLTPVRTAGRRVVEVDGWPVLEAVDGLSTTDNDVQRWRDGDQR